VRRALPLDLVSRVVELLTRGRIARGYLGIGVHPVRVPGADGARRRERQAVGPQPGSWWPDEQAGLIVGDILVSIQGRPLDAPLQLLEELGGDELVSRYAGVIRGGNSTESASSSASAHNAGRAEVVTADSERVPYCVDAPRGRVWQYGRAARFIRETRRMQRAVVAATVLDYEAPRGSTFALEPGADLVIELRS
jgi:hypothetical protein